MLRKALIALYAIEALYLLVPWQYFINGRLLLNYNDGIAMCLGVPGFYAFARIVMRYGPTLWVRLGAMAWTLIWIVAALTLIDNHPEGKLVLKLSSWILACNFIAVAGPIAVRLRGISQWNDAHQGEPSAVALGVGCWALLASAILAFLAADWLPYWRFKSTLIGATLAPIVLLSPVIATAGVLNGAVELRRDQGRRSALGVGLSSLLLLSYAAICVLVRNL